MATKYKTKNIIVIDGGNGTSVAITGQVKIGSNGQITYDFPNEIPEMFRSQVSKPSKQFFATNKLLKAGNSTMIEYKNGTASDRYLQRMLYGDLANQSKDLSTPLDRALDGQGKVNASLDAVMACIRPTDGVTQTIVVILHQNPEKEGLLEQYQTALCGHHEFVQGANNPVTILDIAKEDIILLPESWSGYYHAVAMGDVPFRETGSSQVVVDMGGGTAQTIILQGGYQTYKVSNPLGSVLRLAQLIEEKCDAVKLDRNRLLYYLQRDLPKQKFIYGEHDSHTAFDFTKFVKPAILAWLNEWRQSLNRLLQDAAVSNTYETIFMGGGSFFLAEKLFTVGDNPTAKSLMELNNTNIMTKATVPINYVPWVHCSSPTHANVLGAKVLLTHTGNADWFPEQMPSKSGLHVPVFAVTDR